MPFVSCLFSLDTGSSQEGSEPARADGVSLFTALEEQWGLKLEPTREVMDVLVIDSVERPMNDIQ